MGKKKPRLWPPVPQRMTDVRLFDNHTHLPLLPGEYVADSAGERFNAQIQVCKALEAGVEKMLVSACELPEVAVLLNDPQRFRAEEFASVSFAVAIHPNDAPHHEGILDTGPDNVLQHRKPHEEVPFDEAFSQVERAAKELDFVVAIGESGLDYFRTADSGIAFQKRAFIAHIELAKSLDLPLQIHDRDAHADCIEILQRVGSPRRTVFHCFSGDGEMADILAQNGWYASFSGNVTYPRNTDLQDGARRIPAELCLIETDAPYLTPQPWRGHPNASYLLGHTARYLAELTQTPFDVFCEQTYKNAAEIYGL